MINQNTDSVDSNQNPDHISYSELVDWNICPHFHKLKWIDKLKKFEQNIFSIFGTALHNAAERLVLEEYISRTKNQIFSYKRKETEELFQKQFQEEINKWLGDREPSEEEKELILRMYSKQGPALLPNILDALRSTFSFDYELHNTEELLMEPIPEDPDGKKFKGYVDLILKDSSGIFHIIDWKTCSWGWDAKEKSSKMKTYQLTLYKNFFSQKSDIPLEQIKCHFALLKRTAREKSNIEIFEVPVGKIKIKNALELLEEANFNIKAKHHPKNLLGCRKHFGKCPFEGTEHCKKGW